MNRFGYLRETIDPYADYNEAELYQNHFGNYYSDGDTTDSDSSDDFDNEFGNYYSGNDTDSSDSESSDDDDENDFGKKLSKSNNQASRAMKLARREDISLKEAWAIVKGNKSSSRKKTKKRTKKSSKSKSSSSDLRSKAMKLYQKNRHKGMTLKKAWKQVKK
jgi:hypothetical protein